jgi:hypothetical protein
MSYNAVTLVQPSLLGGLDVLPSVDGMPTFAAPTRDTAKRNSLDVSDLVEYARQATSVCNRYPIYIISKGRWETRKTSKALDRLSVNYKIVVEPSEAMQYAKVIDPDKILVLPGNFSEKGEGSIPVRNWVWDHSLNAGFTRHWVLDDNLDGFGIQSGGRRVNTSSNADFLAITEDFADKYSNVAIAGIRYRFHHNYVRDPYILNTRIYSCILVRNDIPFRWRGRYNEDTDLSLRVLKAGYATALMTWCYCNKAATLTMKGGNEEIYAESNNRFEFAQSLVDQHPDVAKVVEKYGRYHHLVDYRPFRSNPLEVGA